VYVVVITLLVSVVAGGAVAADAGVVVADVVLL
jgi:hypothetical protein